MQVNPTIRLVYPEGWAARTNNFEFVRFSADPSYEHVIAAFGGKGFVVNSPRELPGVLKQALRVVRDEGRQALVNVKCGAVAN